MATYKEIHGVKIQYRDSDATAVEGDVWYNASTSLLKMYASAGTWATGDACNTGRQVHMCTAGTQTSNLIAGRYDPPSGITESYNGSSWTEVADLNTARAFLGGTGASNAAALAIGGYTTAAIDNNESWNGTSWTEVADINTARYGAWGYGTTTAALAAGGIVPTPARTAVVEKWNGASWTEVGDLIDARTYGSGGGTSTAAIYAGGSSPGQVAVSETWDGSSWTEGNNLNDARQYMAGSGTATATLIFGGDTPAKTGNTESYNGTSWTEVNNLNTARSMGGGSPSGTSTAALAVSGVTSGVDTAVEEFSETATVETVSFD